MALPAVSFTPVVIVAVYVVEYDRLLEGVNVATLLLYETVPLMLLPLLLLSVKVLVLIVDELISSLNVAVIVLLMATPVALLAGLVELTVGGVVSDGGGVVPDVDVVNDDSPPYDVPALFCAAIR